MKAFLEELKKHRKDILTPGVILFVITAIVVGILAVVNGLTEEVIAQNKTIAYENALKAVMPGAETFKTVKQEERVTVEKAFDAGGVSLGSCVLVTADGYVDKIQIMVGIDADGTVTAVEILSSSETAGLGAKVKSEAFRSQFIGRPEAKLKKDGGRIDAVSGATVSSRAVANAVQTALDAVSGREE